MKRKKLTAVKFSARGGLKLLVEGREETNEVVVHPTRERDGMFSALDVLTMSADDALKLAGALVTAARRAQVKS